MFLRCKNRSLDLTRPPRIMGILNTTPDSFSDGGLYVDPAVAVDRALEMLALGADIIDIGGESTRPGSDEVQVQSEIDRVVPVVKALRERSDCFISVDTRKSAVAREAVYAGADIINDVSGLEYSSDMAETAADTGAGLVIMHMRGTPDTMQSQENLTYKNVVEDVADGLMDAARKAERCGVATNSIALDPGIGFAKNLEQNLLLLRQVKRLREIGYPLLYGPSRKSFIGSLLQEQQPEKRVLGTVGAVCWLASQGVEIVRVHDCREVNEALIVHRACQQGTE